MMRFALGLTFAVLASGCGGDLAPTLVRVTPDGGPPVTMTDGGPMGAVDDGGPVIPIEPTVNESADSGAQPADASVTPPTLALDDPDRLPFACPDLPATKIPSQLAQFPGGDSLAIDPQYLYFTDNGQASVGRIAPTGGSPQTIVTGQPGPLEVHVHGSHVCWRTLSLVSMPNGDSSEAQGIWCSSTATLMPTQVLSASNLGGNITSFDFDDQYAYYTFAPYVFRVPLDGSAQPEVFAADDEPRTPYSPMAVTLAGGKVYWATIQAGGAGAIKTCPTGATCTPQVLGSFLGSDAFLGTSNLAVSDTHVYWMSRLDSAEISHGDVLRVPIGGGTPVRLATCDESPKAVAIDSQAVYWVTALWGPNATPPGNAWRLPLDGSPPTRLAVLADAPRALAVGDGHVFWMTDSTSPALFGAIVP